jgi:hypothetical protein
MISAHVAPSVRICALFGSEATLKEDAEDLHTKGFWPPLVIDFRLLPSRTEFLKGLHHRSFATVSSDRFA